MFRAIRNMINRVLGRPVIIDLDHISLEVPIMDIQGLVAGILQPYQHDFNIQDRLINFDVVPIEGALARERDQNIRMNHPAMNNHRDLVDILNRQPPAGGNHLFGLFRVQPAVPAQPRDGAQLRTMNPGVGG